jgi:hypothetical protein
MTGCTGNHRLAHSRPDKPDHLRARKTEGCEAAVSSAFVDAGNPCHV